MQSYIYDSYTAVYKPTIGTDFAFKYLELNGARIRLNIWDTAGQERQHYSICNTYYRGVDGVIAVYDCTDEDS